MCFLHSQPRRQNTPRAQHPHTPPLNNALYIPCVLDPASYTLCTLCPKAAYSSPHIAEYCFIACADVHAAAHSANTQPLYLLTTLIPPPVQCQLGQNSN